MKWLKIVAVILFAVVITTLGIDAADTLSGKGGTMLGQIVGSDAGVCPKGMVEVPNALSFTCVDKWEASTGEKCPDQNPGSQTESQKNINDPQCMSESKSGVQPWRFVTREQAKAACVRAGKRLPSASEWYEAAIGTVDNNSLCNVDNELVMQSGQNTECVSAAGAEDMIGNVWEWVNDDIIDGQYKGRLLPDEGYVVQVDNDGVATKSDGDGDDMFGNDYIWTSKTGAYGILRGGFYGSEEDAGLYALHGKTAPTAAGTAIGFRCVR